MIAVKSQPLKTTSTPKYPYLGKSVYTDMVVLFTSANRGVVLEVADNKHKRVGDYTILVEENFKPYSAEVTIISK